jgi:hypothetical protein
MVSSSSASRRCFGAAPAPPVLPGRGHRPPTAVAVHTGPAGPIRGRSLIVLADLENLLYSARDLGYSLPLPGLARWLRETAGRCVLHGFLSLDPGRAEPELRALCAEDWNVHVNPIEVHRTHQGLERRANADNLMLFCAGSLVSRTPVDTVLVVASGDGDLATSLARCARTLWPAPREVITLSLAGSTSWRLQAGRNPLIAANLEIGRDVLRPATEARGGRPFAWRY